jgi:hypothetical protein
VEGVAAIEAELWVVYRERHFGGGLIRVPDDGKTGDILND